MARKIPQNRQQVMVRIETLAHQSKGADGTLNREKFVELWEKELHNDTTLLGFDFRAHAVSDVDRFFGLRHPDWSLAVPMAFAERLWIAFNEKGDMVLVLSATRDQWKAFKALQQTNNKRQNASYDHFVEKDGWLTKHWKAKHGDIGDVMDDNPNP